MVDDVAMAVECLRLLGTVAGYRLEPDAEWVRSTKTRQRPRVFARQIRDRRSIKRTRSKRTSAMLSVRR